MSQSSAGTPLSDIAWKVANAAIDTAFDVAVAEMLAEFREKFPQVQALWGVSVTTENGMTYVDFDAVIIKNERRPATSIKPENANAIRCLLRTHLDRYGLFDAAQDALDRYVSDDGLLWTERTEPYVSTAT